MAYFFLLGIPIFHFGLSVSVFKIALFCAISCALQLAVTPWMFSARITSENPTGNMQKMFGALALWGTLNLFTLLIFIQHAALLADGYWEATLLFDGFVSSVLGLAAFIVGKFWAPRE
jgi:hypothetical protein